MASTHVKSGTSGAFGHEGSPEAEYNIRGRRAGGKLHRAGAKKAKPAEASPIVAKAMVVHAEKAETALTARITAALKRINARIATEAPMRAAVQFERLEAIQYKKFVSAAESTRARLVVAGTIR